MVPTSLLCRWVRRDDGLEKRWRPGGSAWLGRAQVWTEKRPFAHSTSPKVHLRPKDGYQPAFNTPLSDIDPAQKDQQLWITLLRVTTPLSRIRGFQETSGENEWLTLTDSTKATTDSDPFIFMDLHSHHSVIEKVFKGCVPKYSNMCLVPYRFCYWPLLSCFSSNSQSY